ncbi:unnamed protein product, partial [Rotaria magnacalcarata]
GVGVDYKKNTHDKPEFGRKSKYRKIITWTSFYLIFLATTYDKPA